MTTPTATPAMAPSTATVVASRVMSLLMVEGVESARVLWQHLGEVPVLVFPCFQRHGWHRTNPNRQFVEASVYGSIFPAVWSFQLACHARGIGSCLITGHLNDEDAVADLLGLPDDIGQAGMIAVAHIAADKPFRSAPRRPVD